LNLKGNKRLSDYFPESVSLLDSTASFWESATSYDISTLQGDHHMNPQPEDFFQAASQLREVFQKAANNYTGTEQHKFEAIDEALGKFKQFEQGFNPMADGLKLILVLKEVQTALRNVMQDPETGSLVQAALMEEIKNMGGNLGGLQDILGGLGGLGGNGGFGPREPGQPQEAPEAPKKPAPKPRKPKGGGIDL
jgi:hypothetical protein